MKRDKGKKKNLGKVILWLLGFIVVAESAVVLYLRSDWRFLAAETVKGWFSHVEYERFSQDELELTEWTLTDLLATKKAEQDCSLYLVNKTHLLPSEYEPKVSEYKTSGVIMGDCLKQSYEALVNDIKKNFSTSLYINSSYRTPEKQKEILETSSDGVAAEVGASEHQAGLALDVYVNGYSGRAILKHPAGRYLNSNCYQYGFIIRYPLFGEKKTNTVFEPWHIRYVGVPHAELMYLEGLVLEDYMEFLKEADFIRYQGYLITRQEHEPFLLPAEFEHVVISEDNCGGYVITVKSK